MSCAINNIKTQILTKIIKIFAAQNITHRSQWKITEDFDISDLIRLIQLKRVEFLQTTWTSGVS